MGTVREVIEAGTRATGQWVDRRTACEIINEAAGFVAYDAKALVRDRARVPSSKFIDGMARYRRADCEAFGAQLAERRAERTVAGGTPDAA